MLCGQTFERLLPTEDKEAGVDEDALCFTSPLVCMCVCVCSLTFSIIFIIRACVKVGFSARRYTSLTTISFTYLLLLFLTT